MSDTVLCDVSGPIATLTLNRPEKLNAINYELADTMMALLDRLETDEAVRLLIITGAGDRAFSAGGDIHEFSESIKLGAQVAVKEFVRRGQAMTARVEAFAKPIIVAVNGLAYGGGCELTEAAHLTVASERAMFAKPEINIGIPPTFGGTQRLSRLGGRKRALEYLLTGDPFTAERAYELGLVNKVVAHDDLMSMARDLADRVLRHSPLTAAGILTAVTRGINMPIAEGLLVESDQFAKLVPTHDMTEALEAWKARRQPNYLGK